MKGGAIVSQRLPKSGVSMACGASIFSTSDRLRGVAEGAVDIADGFDHRSRHQRIQPAGEQKDTIAQQPCRIIDASARRRRRHGLDAGLRIRRAEEGARADRRADAERAEQVARIAAAGTRVRPAGDDTGPHHASRMRDVELMRHEAARRDAGNRDGVLVDAQRRQRRLGGGGARPEHHRHDGRDRRAADHRSLTGGPQTTLSLSGEGASAASG